MKGHIAKKGNKYYIVVDVGKTPDGRRRRKWISGFNKKKEAEKALPEILFQLNQGTYAEPTKKTVKQYIEDWLEWKKKRIRPSTLTTYCRLVNNHVFPHIGKIRLDKLHETDIEDLYDNLREEKELAESTIVKIHADILKPAFKRAVRYRYINHNPADIEDPPKQKRRKEIKVWSIEERNRFLETAKGDRQYIFYYLSLNTGMRMGEVLGLKWNNIDLENKVIKVRYTLTSHTRELSEPKTESSKRDIVIDDITLQELKKRLIQIKEDKLKAGELYNDQGFVCCSKTGEPLLQSNVRRKFNSLIKKADVPKIRIHDMRHTWATLQLLAGTDIHTVSQILGHSSVWFTYDTYVHLLPEMQREAAETQMQLINSPKM